MKSRFLVMLLLTLQIFRGVKLEGIGTLPEEGSGTELQFSGIGDLVDTELAVSRELSTQATAKSAESGVLIGDIPPDNSTEEYATLAQPGPSTPSTPSMINATVEPSASSSTSVFNATVEPSASSSTSVFNATEEPSASSSTSMINATEEPSASSSTSMINATVEPSASSSTSVINATEEPSASSSTSVINATEEPSASSSTVTPTPPELDTSGDGESTDPTGSAVTTLPHVITTRSSPTTSTLDSPSPDNAADDLSNRSGKENPDATNDTEDKGLTWDQKEKSTGAWPAIIGTTVTVAVLGFIIFIILKRRSRQHFVHRKLEEETPGQTVLRLEAFDGYDNPGLERDNIQMANFQRGQYY